MRDTYYSLYKWGELSVQADIDDKLISAFEEILKINLPMDQLKTIEDTDVVDRIEKPQLDESIITELISIVDASNIRADDYSRTLFAQGKSYHDALRIREREISKTPDLVISPRDEDELIKIVELCNNNGIAIIPTGGRSSVTTAIEFENGGIAIDCTKHLNRIVSINKTNSTVTVQAGVYGPDLERQLNDAGYTCGHFPQSFEYSTVGGWVAARGAGQESTGYGKIEHMVLGMRVVTPAGILVIRDYPARSTGPDIAQIITGSEGYFGVITEVTLKIWRMENNRYFSFLFKDWDSGVRAMREVMQGRHGHPFIFRLSDPDQTDIFMRIADLPGWQEKYLDFRGYRSGKRVILIGSVSGDDNYCKFVVSRIKRTCRKNNGMSIGSSPVKHWLRDRFASPYLRDNLMNAKLIVDTLETSCRWDNITEIRRSVRETILSRPNTLCMVHISHCYENGANLYFTIISKLDEDKPVDNFESYQRSIIQSIKDAGGTLSHHHGIGRLFRSWMDGEIGDAGTRIIRGIKNELDPNNIMNPGVLLPEDSI